MNVSRDSERPDAHDDPIMPPSGLSFLLLSVKELMEGTVNGIFDRESQTGTRRNGKQGI